MAAQAAPADASILQKPKCGMHGTDTGAICAYNGQLAYNNSYESATIVMLNREI
jgi:hypothetical protein